jgi:hemoglobin
MLHNILVKGVSNMTEPFQSPYEAIGGEQILSKLVDEFYARVAKHPDLAPIFPKDLTETARKQKQFLTQYLGGPPLYTAEHGHPMLRARHLSFPITPTRAKAWLACMNEAMNAVGLQGPVRDEFYQRLILTAHHMINTPDNDRKEHVGE